MHILIGGLMGALFGVGVALIVCGVVVINAFSGASH